MEKAEITLSNFIIDQRKLNNEELKLHGINWNDNLWECSSFLPHRGHDKHINFIGFKKHKTESLGFEFKSLHISSPYLEFMKAFSLFLKRKRNIGFLSIKAYLNSLRLLYCFMNKRNEVSPTQLTLWHFNQVIELLITVGYKNIYDSYANLKIIADSLDEYQLCSSGNINLLRKIKPTKSYNKYVSDSSHLTKNNRFDDGKLPSYEALRAYAICTNNPIDDHEEILLRTIDLLLATGLRGNEITHLPYDCLIERIVKDKKGNTVKDNHKNPIVEVGLRYYAEKKFQPRTHWFAKQDVKFAKRAIYRLRELTEEARSIAIFQEKTGRPWDLDPTAVLSDDNILEHIQYASHQGLHFLLARNNVRIIHSDSNKERINKSGNLRYKKRNYYLVGDIENYICSRYKINHDVLINDSKVILKTSDLLALKFVGMFQFKERGEYINKLRPGKVLLKNINNALGTEAGMESIFERRSLTEADGSKIVLTSHQPRHWRNTLYELAGMSNVQQTLAIGRQSINQNPYYQHLTLSEKTTFQNDFINFRRANDKKSFIQNAIRTRQIEGDISSTYHNILESGDKSKAEDFLKVHATALHITPFGGCTHDFSQAPCPLHLQCFDGCSHLHRTNTPGEDERISEQIELSQQVVLKFKNSEDYFGKDKWIEDIESKIENMKSALELKPTDNSIKVFPEGKPKTLSKDQQRRDSV